MDSLLISITFASEENSVKAKEILGLYSNMEIRIPEITHSQYSIQAIDVLFSNPIISSKDFAAKARIPSRTAQRIIQKLEQEGILRLLREGKGSRAPVYLFTDLLDIAGVGNEDLRVICDRRFNLRVIISKI